MKIEIEAHDHELLAGDVFAVDRKTVLSKGSTIQESSSFFNIDNQVFFDMPKIKCNTVSYLKRESAQLNCRNVLAVNESYICYVVRKNLVRIIHKITGDKDLLRGHEHSILDIKFSFSNKSNLCTIDDGDSNSASSSINIWSLKDPIGGGEFTHTNIFNASLQASIVQSYPLLDGSVWAIAHKSHFGIISNLMVSKENKISEYNELQMNASTISANATISDLCFSTDGQTLAVAETLSIEGTTQIVLRSMPPAVNFFACSSLLSVATRIISIDTGITIACQFLNSTDLMTCTSIECDSVCSRMVRLQLWYGSTVNKHKGTQSETALSVQSISFRLPIVDVEGSQYSSNLEFALLTSKQHNKFVCLTCRVSSFVVCLALCKHDASEIYPLTCSISHVCMLPLAFPVFSMCASSLMMKDEHQTVEEIEYLELNTFQESSSKTGQSVMQQFYVPVSHLAPTFCYKSTIPPSWYQTLDESVIPKKSSGYNDSFLAVSSKPRFNHQTQKSHLSPSITAIKNPLTLIEIPDEIPGDKLKHSKRSKSLLEMINEKKIKTNSSNLLKYLPSVSNELPQSQSFLVAHGTFSNTLFVANDGDAKILAKITTNRKEDGIINGSTTNNSDEGTTGGKKSQVMPVNCSPHSKTSETIFSCEVEHILSSIPRKNELIVAITQSVKADLLKSVSSTAEQNALDTIEKTVAESILMLFESTILPAFQIGADLIFTQVQSSIEIGMVGLEKQFRSAAEAQQIMVELITSMKYEILFLRNAVTKLEANAGIALLTDPFTFLHKGRIAEAIEAALEYKDTELLVSVLGKITCALVVEHCSTLVLLCTAQQLAADLALAGNPVEVVRSHFISLTNCLTCRIIYLLQGLTKRLEWIKCLVMHLIFTSPISSSVSPVHMRTVMSSVRDSITVTQAKCTDNSVLTDLTMLQHFVLTKLS